MASTSSDDDKKPTNSATGIAPAPEDEYLSNSTHLTRQEVLRRRSYHLKQLTKCYRDHYWGLMEELRSEYRNYVLEFGLSAVYEDDSEEDKDNVQKGQVRDGIVESKDGNGSSNGMQCDFHGCMMKAMTLTRFCSLHILSDPKQQLYKPCDYVIKRGVNDIKCEMPVLSSMVPCLCTSHLQKAQEHFLCALTKTGLKISSNRIVPKLHVIMTEYVREIQERRKTASTRELEIDD